MIAGFKKWFFVLLLLGVVLLSCFSFDNRGVKDDYYDSVNQKFLSKNRIPKGEYTWSTFNEAQEKSDQLLDSVVDDIILKKEVDLEDGLQDKMRVVYQNVLLKEKRNMVGIEPLRKYLDGIWESNSLEDFIDKAILIENELGIDIFTNIVVSDDYLDNEKAIVYLYPVTFSFGTSADYWVDDDYMAYKAYVKRAMIQLLKVYGYSQQEAREMVREVVSFYESVSSKSKLAADFLDVKSYYNVVDVENLRRVYSNLNVDSYLKKRGIANREYSLVDEGAYRGLNQFLIEDNLETLKQAVVIKVLSQYAWYASEDYVKVITELNSALMGVDDGDETLEERARDIVYEVFSDEVDFLYQERVMKSSVKEYLFTMTDAIRKYYQKMLKENTWLSDETKEIALDKLEKMSVHVGNDFNVSFLGNDYVIRSFDNGGSLIDNIREVKKVRYRYELAKLDDPTIKSSVSQSVVNAYYSPLDNSIYIPTAATFLFDLKKSYYENLGSIGMVIAHEMTHGFDGNGAQFDQEGNLDNWWTDDDFKHYELLKGEVSDYYSQYEVLSGHYINGDQTVNENIADLGALSCITGLAQEKEASEKEIQEMLESFAQMWASQSTDEYLKLLLLQDSHAPNKYRVNAVLSSTDEYYRAYHVGVFSDMYLPPDSRVKVW